MPRLYTLPNERFFPADTATRGAATRTDYGYQAELVVQHRLPEDEAVEVARDLAYNLVKEAYRL